MAWHLDMTCLILGMYFMTELRLACVGLIYWHESK